MKRPVFGASIGKPIGTSIGKPIDTPFGTPFGSQPFPIAIPTQPVAETKTRSVQYTLSGVADQDRVFQCDDDVVLLNDIHSSVIVLYSHAVTLTHRNQTKKSVHLSNIDHSIVMITEVDGSILAHRITNSVVIARCSQFRLHDSTDSLLSLVIPNFPVVENCDRLTFSDATKDWAFSPSGENRFSQVRDFNWFQSSPSPHWEAGTVESYMNTYAPVRNLLNRLHALLDAK